jgi:RHH-type proline utilization regulon transcriptional repressor/proline dehydrogenase/delta 1-pyrroline-5-carboxylate dehydrogenase
LADLIEQHTATFSALLITEAGKTLHNALQEIREACDYCRYYAAQCRQHFSHVQPLPGPTGEVNEMRYEGRGVIVCISPWNFPLAILLGQITAALAAGNCVIAKPATQGELVARQVAQLLKTAGFPEGCCYFTPCSARVFATVALPDPKVAGVCFTGSLEAAQEIQRELVLRDGPLAYMSAETGGQNAMIVDSTALCEQVVIDAMTSAFDSAGQRCSALRVLCLQNEIAPKVIEQLRGRMQLLRVGDPLDWQTDIGPVTNESAQKKIQAHIARLNEKNLLLATTPLDKAIASQGYFVSPTLIEIDHINILKQEIFGPVLHILRFDKNHLPQLIEQINGSGYGLTLGIHTRIDSRAQQIAQQVRCGNIYINRNMIGAVVGSQPFGGMGLSGSGQKNGGPDTLLHLCQRKSISNNVAAIGGNAALLAPHH